MVISLLVQIPLGTREGGRDIIKYIYKVEGGLQLGRKGILMNRVDEVNDLVMEILGEDSGNFGDASGLIRRFEYFGGFEKLELLIGKELVEVVEGIDEEIRFIEGEMDSLGRSGERDLILSNLEEFKKVVDRYI